ncbi:MAG: hypothetical protein CL832_08990 [Crocinitomicaceae bacterium]|nr:hypothetical protein [Crocinitomicaceae bacterium]
MRKQIRYLTKSRFNLGLECPNKLYFTNKKNEYQNLKQENPFLLALASGGFQVEEFARRHYPSGVLIEDEKNNGFYDYDQKVLETNELLKRENVVIFEAAFCYKNLFVRVDIIEKKGDQINLIEVKAKSFKKDDKTMDVKFSSKWKYYLFDVAFQKYVIEKAFPQFYVTPYLMLADKNKSSNINGLNQLFRINKNNKYRTGIDVQENSLADIDINQISVLSLVNISDLITKIENSEDKILNLDFEKCIQALSDTYNKDKYYGSFLKFEACKKCEFKTNENSDNLKSGFEFCFTKQLNWTANDFKKPNIFEIWDVKSFKKFKEDNALFLSEITEEHLGGVKLEPNKISRTERQWIQVQKSLNQDNISYLLKEELKSTMSSWCPPFNFIDFECSTSPLPFFKNQNPYQEVSFQFSHHIYHENGKIEHASEYINVTQGKFPNIEFVRELKKSLQKNKGSIFMYSNYENSVLNRRLEEIENSNEVDKNELINFIKSITRPSRNSSKNWQPSRAMIDLHNVVKCFYYNPYTKGSISIKKVLPAIFKTSSFIRKKYSQPINKIDVNSSNFPDEKIWLSLNGGQIIDPYTTLKPIVSEFSSEIEFIDENEEISDGGAAMVAYGKTQYTEMSELERNAIKKSLLKYCELDTLAMVMIFEYLKELTK